jgi:hypothetical protein
MCFLYKGIRLDTIYIHWFHDVNQLIYIDTLLKVKILMCVCCSDSTQFSKHLMNWGREDTKPIPDIIFFYLISEAWIHI